MHTQDSHLYASLNRGSRQQLCMYVYMYAFKKCIVHIRSYIYVRQHLYVLCIREQAAAAVCMHAKCIIRTGRASPVCSLYQGGRQQLQLAEEFGVHVVLVGVGIIMITVAAVVGVPLHLVFGR
jgi:hypothetical protein